MTKLLGVLLLLFAQIAFAQDKKQWVSFELLDSLNRIVKVKFDYEKLIYDTTKIKLITISSLYGQSKRWTKCPKEIIWIDSIRKGTCVPTTIQLYVRIWDENNNEIDYITSSELQKDTVYTIKINQGAKFTKKRKVDLEFTMGKCPPELFLLRIHQFNRKKDEFQTIPFTPHLRYKLKGKRKKINSVAVTFMFKNGSFREIRIANILLE